MATLTDAQKSEIRLLSGDDCVGAYIVSDTQLQLFWDAVGNVICATVIKVLQSRLADATKTVYVDETGRAPGQNPKVAQIQTALDYWMNNCPEALPALGTLYINLGIDEETSLVDIEQ